MINTRQIEFAMRDPRSEIVQARKFQRHPQENWSNTLIVILVQFKHPSFTTKTVKNYAVELHSDSPAIGLSTEEAVCIAFLNTAVAQVASIYNLSG